MRASSSKPSALPWWAFSGGVAAPAGRVSPRAGAPEAQAAVGALRARLLPAERVSRRAFIDMPVGEPVEQAVSLKDMLAVTIGAWVLEMAMPLASSNHKSSAACDAWRGRDLATRYEAHHRGVGDGEVVRGALEIAFTGTGTCTRHAAYAYVLAGAMLRQVLAESPALREHLPTVELIVDPSAGQRLGGPPGDAHVFVVLQGDSRVVVDPWVLFPKIHLASEARCRMGEPHETYDVLLNPDSLPADVIARLDALAQHRPAEPAVLDDEHYRRDEHWFVGEERLRGWQLVSSFSEDVPVVYVCGDLRHDPDRMGAEGLQIRKRRAQAAAHALVLGEQSPIRGAPDFSPWRREAPPDADDH